MLTLFILRGLPGSGKSTVAAELIRKEPGRFVRVNCDDLRAMTVGPNNHPRGEGRNEREELVIRLRDEIIRQAFRGKFDVISDDTNLVPGALKRLHKLAASVGDVRVIEKCLNESVATCIARNVKRDGFARFDDIVIKNMARASGLDRGHKLLYKETYYPPRWCAPGDPIVQDINLPHAVICDLDNTLALVTNRSPYDATNCDKDLPNRPVVECIKAMYTRGCEVLFTSGREDKFRAPTETFIAQHLPGYDIKHGQSTWYHLFMRPTGDHRQDAVIKSELYEAHIAGKFYVEFVLDDRNQVVDFWRSIGLTCFQVAPGDF